MSVSLIIWTAVSFTAGVVGYIITRFWIRPIAAYRLKKRRISIDLNRYETIVRQRADVSGPDSESKQLLLRIRKTITELTSTYQNDVPYWYRLKCQSRGESPEEASAPLLGLANVTNKDHAIKRIRKARMLLKISARP